MRDCLGSLGIVVADRTRAGGLDVSEPEPSSGESSESDVTKSIDASDAFPSLFTCMLVGNSDFIALVGAAYIRVRLDTCHVSFSTSRAISSIVFTLGGM
jgi:hypothetical protein